MEIAVWIVGGFLAITLAAHLASIALTLFRTLGAKRPAPHPAATPPVTILRPVCGLEFDVEETLRSTFELDWPDYEIVFCCASATDPVVPLVERLISEYPRVPARLLTGDDRISINPKLNNLVKGWQAATHDFVLMSDSNVILPRDYLATLFARLDATTGLVCSPPIGGRASGFGAELECAFLNSYQARWQLTGDTIGNGFAQGKTMLWRREVLDNAGGIRALAAEPAEDAAATKVVRAAGLCVRLVPGPFVQPLGMRRFAQVWGRQLRWARLRRVTFKLYFVPELAMGAAFPLAAAILLAVTGIVPAWLPAALFALWYGAEAILVRAAGWHLTARSPIAWVARDLLLAPLWFAAWAGNGFNWRGHAMSVAADDAEPGFARLFERFTRLAVTGDDGEPRSAWSAAIARRWRGRRSRSAG